MSKEVRETVAFVTLQAVLVVKDPPLTHTNSSKLTLLLCKESQSTLDIKQDGNDEVRKLNYFWTRFYISSFLLQRAFLWGSREQDTYSDGHQQRAPSLMGVSLSQCGAGAGKGVRGWRVPDSRANNAMNCGQMGNVQGEDKAERKGKRGKMLFGKMSMAKHMSCLCGILQAATIQPFHSKDKHSIAEKPCVLLPYPLTGFKLLIISYIPMLKCPPPVIKLALSNHHQLWSRATWASVFRAVKPQTVPPQIQAQCLLPPGHGQAASSPTGTMRDQTLLHLHI